MTKETGNERAILDRIRHLEEAVAKGREYLVSGKHAAWYGFQPLFVNKNRDGSPSPPHKDWVRNVFLPSREKALRKAQDKLDRVRGDSFDE